MSELLRWIGDVLLADEPDDLPPRLRREMNRGAARESARGVVRAAAAEADAYVAEVRVRAAAHVTHTGLSNVADLSVEEARLLHRAPLGAARYQAIVDQYTGLVATEIAKLGRGR